MGAAVLGLVAALAGGLATLVTVSITQRGSLRLQEQQQAQADRHRLEDQIQDWNNRLIQERRVTYTKLNAAARTAREGIASCVYTLKDGSPLSTQVRDALEERWASYVVQHAEAHMIVSDAVLNLLGSVNGSLRVMYGMVKRLDGGTPRPTDSVPAMELRLEELWQRLELLREAMRRDLGVTDNPAP